MTTSEERCIDRGQMNVLDAVGPMLDAWDSLSNDERGGISRDAPLFVQHLTKLRYLAEDTMTIGTPPRSGYLVVNVLFGILMGLAFIGLCSAVNFLWS